MRNMIRHTVVGIFVPVYYREEKVRACIGSLMGIHPVNGMDVHLMVGINGASQQLRSLLLDEMCGEKMPWTSYKAWDFGENVGKPKAVNLLVNMMAKDMHLDYVVSCDSDMVATDSQWLYRFVDAFEEFPDWANLGCLSTDQDGERCHVLDKDPFYFKSNDGKYSYVTRAGNEGVAGGCIITPYHVWRTIGGYHAHRIYASDDGHFALACAQRGLTMAVVNEVTLIHPPGDDQAYSMWKYRATSDTLSDEERKGFYE